MSIRKHLSSIILTIVEIVTVVIYVIINIAVMTMFNSVDSYWNNGPLTGYEDWSHTLEIFNNIRIIFTIILILINIIIGIVLIAQFLADITSAEKIKAVINLCC